MQKMTDAQRRKIFKLASQKGLDDEMRRSHIHALIGKESLTELTIKEAITVIDSLEDEPQTTKGKISHKQQKYLQSLAVEYGWVCENKRLDTKKLNKWLENRYGVSSIIWLTSKNASDAIEGLKVMIARGSIKEAEGA